MAKCKHYTLKTTLFAKHRPCLHEFCVYLQLGPAIYLTDTLVVRLIISEPSRVTLDLQMQFLSRPVGLCLYTNLTKANKMSPVNYEIRGDFMINSPEYWTLLSKWKYRQVIRLNTWIKQKKHVIMTRAERTCIHAGPSKYHLCFILLIYLMFSHCKYWSCKCEPSIGESILSKHGY